MTTNLQRIAASYEIARAVVNEARHPYVTSATDIEIIDFWRSACGIVVMWSCKYGDPRQEVTSIPLPPEARDEIVMIFGL